VVPEGRPLPDFNLVHKELKSRKSVTLQLLCIRQANHTYLSGTRV
jgi:hypothetical protein